MSSISSGRPGMAGVERSLNRSGLGEVIYRCVHFPTAGEEVLVLLDGTYAIQELEPSGKYRVMVVSGDKRAVVRRGSSTWTWEEAYFVSDKSDVYADIAIEF